MGFNIKNKNVKCLILFCLYFILTLSFSTFLVPLYNADEIWNYGFSYNLSIGMIPYKDFSMLQTPLYFYIGSIFIKIFGSYLFSLHIFDALFIALIMLMVYDTIGKKSFFVYPFLVIMLIPSYNFFCLYFIFLIMYLIYKGKDNDLLIGFIVGLMFITKQSIGIMMLVPLVYSSKKKVKSFIMFLIPVGILSLYLLFNGAFYEFIDHCFFGMLDFGDNNKLITIFCYIEIIQIIFMGILLLKNKFKDITLFYILAFQVVSYPIFDPIHWLVAFLPFFYYVCYEFRREQFRNVFNFVSFIIVFGVAITVLVSNISNLIDSKVMIDKNTDNYFYLRNISLVNEIGLEAEEIVIMEYREDYDYQFFIMHNSYLRKLYMSIDIDKYDMLLNGNMGYNGDERIVGEVKEICDNNSCIFYVEDMFYDDTYNQFSKKIYYYVINNYKLKEEYPNFSIYTN